MNFNLLQIASMIAIVQAILMAFMFFRSGRGAAGAKITSGRKTSNAIVTAILLTFAAITASSLMVTIRPWTFNPRYHSIIFMLGNLAFVIGPLLYFYVRSLLESGFAFRTPDVLHLVPFVIAEICAFMVLQMYGAFYVWKYPGRIYFSGAILLQNLAYCIAAFRILRLSGLSFRSFLSYIDDSRLAWARFFITGYILLWSVQLQLFIGWDVLNNPRWCPYATSLYFLIAFLFFNGMVYIGLKRPEMIHQPQKYQSSALKKSDKDQFQERLVGLMQKERIFLNPDVSLPQVAERLDIAPQYVSQIINETFRQNFRDFINGYRIEESKQMLVKEDQNLNILGIAYNVGFNSKSSFNSAFKKYTGVTPKEFRRQSLTA